MKTVRRDALRPGDHIYSDRTLRLYFHHGIYVGDDMVIHLMGPSKIYDRPPCKKCGFKPQTGIFKTCLDCFLEAVGTANRQMKLSKQLIVCSKTRASAATIFFLIIVRTLQCFAKRVWPEAIN
ncbi:uncharacterized protein LOC111277873 isoform X2 [Durio zibethinus]|uniref:Uncharacterized protein LOC111277873 isoform X2 n=1 Tax=Durio zibethinus TaxID=66656 RepID=A0A6P5WW24_DURZI|nr:uncharacterized protein LOC111277873 isoform X2 [Durio zibethinus]